MIFIKEDVYAAARIVGCSYDELIKALSLQIKEGFSIVPMCEDVPLPPPPDGPLCRLSTVGKQQFPTKSGLKGRVVGVGRADPENMLRVSWNDGEKWKLPELLHKDFIEILGH